MTWPDDIETLNGNTDKIYWAANSMKYLLATTSVDFTKYDLENDQGTADISKLFTIQKVGGGAIAGNTGLQFKDKDSIYTPIFQEIDFETEMMKKVNNKTLFHVKKLGHTTGGKKFTDLWILDHNTETKDTEEL